METSVKPHFLCF